MKVLYVGVWKDGTGWGNAAQNNILALDSVGVDVVPRTIKLANSHNDDTYIPPRILELEKNDEQGCDVCIQHLPPHLMEYNGHFDTNVGIFYCETSHFRNTKWARALNTMDQVWVANRTMLEATGYSLVTSPIAIVPLCFDMSKYSQYYETYSLPDIENKFVFYTICEVVRRKNLSALLRAFHLEFKPNEPVSLLIKGHVPGSSQMNSHRALQTIVQDIKTGLRLYPNISDYHEEILITQWLKHEEVMRIHQTGDCFVLPSYGEAWGIPGFEAMAMGKPVILSDEGGPADYVSQGESGLLIPGRYEPVLVRPEEAALGDVWIGNEEWFSVEIRKLQEYMRRVYESQALVDELSGNGIDRAYDYSYEKVGNQMKGLLDGTTPKTVFHHRASEVWEKHDMSRMVKSRD